jgi:hypothetical protein
MKGQPVTARINGVARHLTFDAAAQTVNFTDNSGPQARKFIACSEEGDPAQFACASADGRGVVFAPNAPNGISANS